MKLISLQLFSIDYLLFTTHYWQFTIQLIPTFRRFRIQRIIIFLFLPNTEIVTKVKSPATGIAEAVTPCIHTALFEYKNCFVGVENIVHAGGNSELFVHELAAQAEIQHTESAQFIKLLLTIEADKTMNREPGKVPEFQIMPCKDDPTAPFI